MDKPIPTGPRRRPAVSLTVMRAVAAALLVAMSLLYILALAMREHGEGWAWLRAFAEAAMVGGLADWFAVTAIFRRPLGLPIPHTGVIPRNKDRIADALGDFVAVNFLSPGIVGDRVAGQRLSAALAGHASDPTTARRLADGVVDALPGLVGLLDDEAVSGFMRRQAESWTRGAGVADLIGGLMRPLTEQGHHQVILDALLAEAWRALEENEAAIREQVRTRTSWAYRLIALDKRAANALIAAVEDTLHGMAHDPGHPGRQRVAEALGRFTEDLQNSPELRAQIQSGLTGLLEHPSVTAFFARLWQDLKTAITATAREPDAAIRRDLASAIARFGTALQTDEAAQAALDRRLRALLVALSERHGRDVGRLISETIHGWDTRTVVEKLEASVGADLQYIRINGTLIGGLIGLAIHQLTLMFAGG